MRTIKVAKITVESYNKLVSLGYQVQVVQQTTKPPVYAKYTYEKDINPKKVIKKMTGLVSKEVCTKKHVND